MMEYQHNIKGNLVKVEIRDETYKVIYKKKFNIKDKNAWWDIINAAEKFGFSVAMLIRDKLMNNWI